MTKRNDAFFLEDILNSIEKILRYTNKMTFQEFHSDEKTLDAVERNFEIIGEAVKKIRWANMPTKY